MDKNAFYVLENGQWNKVFVKGVNLGAGKPGAFPGEVAITYDEYYRWFGYISEMNANTIRVYTIQRPQFYNALYDFNRNAEEKGKKPIYIFHGVWIDETDIITIDDSFGNDDKILNDMIATTTDIIDILHGNNYLPVNKGHADGNYTSDVSKYVIGWILGLEWEPSLVVNTNTNNPQRSNYNGKYLYTEGASPFEAFLAEVGDKLIDYETSTYNMQSPVAFSNWVTTDPLKHPNEPYKNEDLVEVNVEHIKWRDSYKPGMFASYHVYPYYPDTFSYQTDYITYKDKDGKLNPYLAYLEEIKQFHSMPVVISEFGIPASRGKAHENRITGFNQGFIDERTQGEMLVSMMKDIHAAELAGGIVFSWQDEWFKRTWNNNDLDMPDSRPYWQNTQTNEQHFGLLAFDPGSERTVSYIDGEFEDWKDDTPLYEDDKLKLYVKNDEGYVYLMVDAENYDFEKDTILIPIDTIDGQGNKGFPQYGATFGKDADFVVKIHGPNDSRVLVDAYYDNYYFRYAVQTDLIDAVPSFHKKNTGVFNPIRLGLNKQFVVPGLNTEVPFTGYETGLLKYGIANPDSPDFNSLSDFYHNNGKVEIRIPWQLLNVMDPSKKYVIDDMYARGKITELKVKGMSFGVEHIKQGMTKGAQNLTMTEYDWKEWEHPTFHERLKPSYFILQQGFLGFD
ncbi:family 2 glycosyl transferase [Paenibacillus spongiae]|uniref:Family 2 glycosyl transferase n=1 Tax=Paenibacillus spongiae TaxID=2909671 RepID=A0ABY5SAM7_9BACL|nr:family 2 glycosyl transferase [Paenibacillus spongiae]UVI30986.1 family 2 glycosyl transferase [Paenibacillus spongiae]